ncbi:MAG: DUF6273 domain-containing protein [Bacillota bacterium]
MKRMVGTRLSSIILMLFLIALTGCSNTSNPATTGEPVGEGSIDSEEGAVEPKEDDGDAEEADGDSEETSGEEQDKSADGTVQIGSLNLGDRLMDESWDWEFRTEWSYGKREGDITSPVIWIVAAKDHYDSPGITLLAENLLGYFPFDTSRVEVGHLAGQNHWGNSGTGNADHGLRPWLNSNGIHEGEGFYAAFSSDFQSIVLETEVPNKEYENGTPYMTTDKVFIPSSTELGDTEHMDTYEIGSAYPFFEGAEDELRTARIMGDDFCRDYWLRNPNTEGYRPVGSVYEYGMIVSSFADFDSIGVRPVINVSSSATVSAESDEDGVYIFKFE